MRKKFVCGTSLSGPIGGNSAIWGPGLRRLHAAFEHDPRKAIGFALDLDGVVWTGPDLIPGSVEAIKEIMDSEVPVVFMTNSGGRSEAAAAREFSSRLGVEVAERQVVLSHTPMRHLADEYGDQVVMVSGKGDAKGLLQGYGFRRVVTTCELLEQFEELVDFFPGLDPPDAVVGGLDRMREEGIVVDDRNPIAAVFVIMSPQRWAIDIQITCDVLRCKGGVPLALPYDSGQTVPLYMSCPDLEYASRPGIPRFGAGAYGKALQHLYESASGKQLQYQWFGKPFAPTYSQALGQLQEQALDAGFDGIGRVYAVGDNPAADILGANNMGGVWRSVLVHTGVFDATNNDNDDEHPAHYVARDLRDAIRCVTCDQDHALPVSKHAE